jgi:hypothetical protein
MLKQVDCLGKQTRVVIEGPERQIVKLMVKVRGTLSCGVQKPRAITVRYTPKIDQRLGTAGEVESLP